VQVALIDETAGATTTSGASLTPGALDQIAAAITIQLNRDVAAYWGLPAGALVRVSTGSDLQPGEVAFAILAALPAAPGAIAYHDVNGVGVPVAFDAITLSDTLTGPGQSLSVALSHECCEIAGDEGCNLWADDGSGTEWAHELCDAVEGTSYPITVAGGVDVYVSNLVLPAFFVPNHAGPFDHLATLTAPFQTKDGYQIRRSSGTGESQVTGMVRRADKRRLPSSRTYHRGVRL
jgi:hypothetical protein